MKKIWIVAGETSGDSRASELMRAIHKLDPSIKFMGAGGPQMRLLAIEPFDNWIAEAGVLGLWDVLKRYRYFRIKFHRMLADLVRIKPDAVLFVDYPGFNLRLAKAIRQKQLKLRILYYISPQVWAWNQRRIPKMARWLDLMLCIFPFEKALYEKSGLQTEFVGHPIVEQLNGESRSIERDPTLVGFFPGSREREVRRIFPIMVAAAKRIIAMHPKMRFEVSSASAAHTEQMRALIGNLPIKIVTGNAHDLMQRAATGIVCSGTATLEAACFGLPYALVYKTAWLTFQIGRHLVNVDYLGIINILAGRLIVREFIQDAATPEALANEVLRLLNDSQARVKLSKELGTVVAALQGEGASKRAARAVLDALNRNVKLTTS